MNMPQVSDKQQAEANSTETQSVDEYLRSVESDIEKIESEEKQRLNIKDEEKTHWHDANPNTFTASQREHTTILHAGLTIAHDYFIQSAFRGLGYKVQAMDVPDTRALQFGREFGNRGQCNPTYFTVGNLVKKLKELEKGGLSKKEIIENYIFATGGSCGPCRFGTYVTEYRKALRDSGFEGFRVVLFQHADGVKQATGEELGLKIDANFFYTMSKALIIGDVLNLIMYRIRPYEVNEGETNRVIAQAKDRIAKAFETRKGMLKALWQSRKELAAIKVDKTRIKPRVAIIGEFWAMTTEGDGNYHLQRFLEQEGAEVDIQIVANWFLYLLWAAKYDTLDRAHLKGADKSKALHDNKGSKFALENVDVAKKLMMIRVGKWVIHVMFHTVAKLLGLRDYHLPDMEHIAKISHQFYNNNLRGGEGHMEVGKLIHNVVDQKVNMTLSVKPFGCMPSSAVSDGVQSLITELYPTAIFLPIETNGDGAVNVYSRIQMQLFKAKQAAEKEVKTLLDKNGLTMEDYQKLANGNKTLSNAGYRSPHFGACSSVDLLQDCMKREQSYLTKAREFFSSFFSRTSALRKQATLETVEKAARAYKERQTSFTETAVKFVEPS